MGISEAHTPHKDIHLDVGLISAQIILLRNIFSTALGNIRACDSYAASLIKRSESVQKCSKAPKEVFRAELVGAALSVQQLMSGRGEYVDLMSYFLISELMRDFHLLALSHLEASEKYRLEELTCVDLKDKKKLSREIFRLLSRIARNDSTLSSMMSLWGRRILGDVLLFIKLCIGQDHNNSRSLLSTLAGKHSERMRAIGLIA
ncbi:MAG: hypothetical protein NKF39_01335 [Tropheryma whipplei]|nr:hypothetical protein [Tropheryma whipplei]